MWAFHSESSYSVKTEIVFHSQLNSPAIPVFVMEGIMFHELVHNKIGNKENHNKDFRALERKFEPSEKAYQNVPKEYESLLKSKHPIKAVNEFLKELSNTKK